ncbi:MULTISPECIES: hypothetical protein [Streptomyces]|uniref:hypothetical protein n=1 Tax=Streptomyces lycopersici TaxID=2974589 RepID=UPI0021CFAFED|nr:hypothetical protein [Streptomyces sp. NEAU-383]
MRVLSDQPRHPEPQPPVYRTAVTRAVRMAAAATACALLLSLTACDTGRSSGSSASGPTAKSTASATEPVIPARDEENCGDEPWSTQNPAYEGPGPHLIAPIGLRSQLPEDIAVGAIPTDLTNRSIGGQYNFGGDESVLTTPMTSKDHQIQLLACIKPTKGTGPPIGKVECYFEDLRSGAVNHNLTFPLYRADYEVTVREARTGHVARNLSVPGTVKGTDNCPTSTVDTGHTVLLRALSRNRLIKALRPLARPHAPRENLQPDRRTERTGPCSPHSASGASSLEKCPSRSGSTPSSKC